MGSTLVWPRSPYLLFRTSALSPNSPTTLDVSRTESSFMPSLSIHEFEPCIGIHKFKSRIFVQGLQIVPSPMPGQISFFSHRISILYSCCSLRKVKMDQRKLNDNANTLVDMAKVRLSLVPQQFAPVSLTLPFEITLNPLTKLDCLLKIYDC